MPDRSRADFIEDFDFEALYQGDPPGEGLASFDVIPWDIGEPQPAVVALERSGQLHGHILDAGCGLGDNALFLAECGYRVTGFDAAPTAITRARERAEDRRVHPGQSNPVRRLRATLHHRARQRALPLPG
jgi:SAM-dependent methyltransferase